jgi:hypothetical protein
MNIGLPVGAENEEDDELEVEDDGLFDNTEELEDANEVVVEDEVEGELEDEIEDEIDKEGDESDSTKGNVTVLAPLSRCTLYATVLQTRILVITERNIIVNLEDVQYRMRKLSNASSMGSFYVTGNGISEIVNSVKQNS